MKQLPALLFFTGLLLLFVAAYKREDEIGGSYLVTLHPYESPSQIARDLGFDDYKAIGSEESRIYLFTHKDNSINAKARHVESLSSHPGIRFAEPDHQLNLRFKQVFNDPTVGGYWHLKKLDPANLDINVYPVWGRGNIGQGVIIGIVDSGIWTNHSDLATNVDPSVSQNLADGSAKWQSDIPDPGKFDHGTFVGATAAGQANNSFCGVGVAYGATIGALKYASSLASTVIASVGFQNNKIWIKNYSLGFAGCNASRYCQLDGISPSVVGALEDSITTGRNGKGMIHVWAASNEGDNGGDTNMSGFTASRCNLAVAATGPNGVQASYSNFGAGVHVAAPGGDNEANNLQGSSLVSNGTVVCTEGSGTSFAAPVVSGVIALMLQQNANLGWRDVKEILLRTAVKNDPNNTDWSTNGAGYHINHKYGFGYVNADAAVKLAANWTNLPAETLVTTNTTSPVNLAAGQTTSTPINVGQNIIVEHVQLILTISGGNSSAFNIVLKSPAGTSSTLLQGNVNLSGSTFNNWVMLTVRNWGESSNGNWVLSIFNQDANQAATLTAYTLALYGRGSASTTTTTTSSSQSSGAASLLPFYHQIDLL